MLARGGQESRRRTPALAHGKVVALAVLFVATLGCTGRGDSAERLGAHTSARLTAGVGLDDLRLGETTLASFTERFGDGVASFFAGDVYGIQLTFEGDELGFLFLAEGRARERLASSSLSEVTRALRPISSFLRTYPECADMRLHSIHVAAGASANSTVYRGATERGIALGSTQTEVLTAYGRPDDLRGLLVSRGNAEDDSSKTAAYRQGVEFTFATPRDGGPPTVSKIAIFVPTDPILAGPGRTEP